MKVSISRGNTKTGKIAAVSLTPIKACNGCGEYCGKDCYAIKAYRQYPGTRQAWDGNLQIAIDDMYGYFGQVGDFLKNYKGKFFRWHVAGDILNYDYFRAMVELAIEFPAINFLAFTKQYSVVNQFVADTLKYFDIVPGNCNEFGIPANLQIVFSAWPGMPMDNPYNFPIAYMQDGSEDRAPIDAIHCPGNCETCGLCWNLSSINRDVVFDKH